MPTMDFTKSLLTDFPSLFVNASLHFSLRENAIVRTSFRCLLADEFSDMLLKIFALRPQNNCVFLGPQDKNGVYAPPVFTIGASLTERIIWLEVFFRNPLTINP